MKLLQELDSVTVVSKTGVSRLRRQGLFHCPKCGEAVQRPFDNGPKSDTCGRKGCRKTTQPTHNATGSKLYVMWKNIKTRCDIPTCNSYQYYGGKGISYPESWKTFEGFFMDMGLTFSEGMSIDRLDHNKNYSKENCQWIPFDENCAKEKQKAIAKFTEDGVFISSYTSVIKAATAEGHPNTTCISRVARGERSHYKGFVWKFI